MVLLVRLVKSEQPSLEVFEDPLYYIYVLLCVYLTCESNTTICCICYICKSKSIFKRNTTQSCANACNTTKTPA